MSERFPYTDGGPFEAPHPLADPFHRESMEAVYQHMEGKTIAQVFTGGSFEGNHLTSVRIVFTDGTSIEMRAHDGSQIDVARNVSL